MQLIVTFDNGTEEAFEVAETTKIRAMLKDNYWMFTPVTGGQVALHVDDVSRVELGAVVHERIEET